MDLTNFKFIPKSYIRGNDKPSIDDLIEVKPKEEIVDWVIKKEEDNYVNFKKSFLIAEKNWGYTICVSPEEKLTLLRSSEDNEIKEAEPKFLKGEKTHNRVKSEYITFLLQHFFPDEIYFQCELVENNRWEIKIAKEEETPKKMINFADVLKPKAKQFTQLSDFIHI
jgi:hypothetical protein